LVGAVSAAAIEAIPKHGTATLAFSPSGDPLQGRRAVEAAEAVVEVLLEVVEPAAALLVVGGGHVGRAVAELGAFLDMSVSVLDDREEYANQERFPFADHVILGDFETELERFPFTSNTFVVLVSRGHIVDQLSLRQVIQHDLAYVGMIGSKRRTRTVLENLESEGVPAERLARVYTPIGLDIESETPEEIALSVLAEIVLLRRGGRAVPLSAAGEALLESRASASPLARRSDTI
jgi:xanthine dehydrogenase accessory factor